MKLRTISESAAWARRKVAGSPRRTLAIAAMLAVALAGAIWLSASDDFSAVSESPIPAPQAAQLALVLERQGIACRVIGGDVRVPARHLARAKAALASLASPKPASPPEASWHDELFSSESQSAKRWQAARMAALGAIIETYPGVRSATVLLEPGSPRRLGSPAVPPTAAVSVVLEDGASLAARTVDAIADLVSGSVAGMTRGDVRIVDSTGRSWWAGSVPGDEHFSRVRAAEAYYCERARNAIRYIDEPIISVTVSGTGDSWSCQRAAVQVPSSWAPVAAASGTGKDPAAPDAGAQLARVRQVLETALDVSPGAVTVDLYADHPIAPAPPAAAQAPSPDAMDHLPLIVGGGLVACVGALLALLGARRRRLGNQPPQPPQPAGPLAFLQQAMSDELASFLQDEHPQTVAMVLAHLPPSKAAGVLAAIPPDRQADVARRVAAFDSIDPQTLRDVERELSERLAHSARAQQGRLGGAEALARMLHYAGARTEQAVLRSLASQEPQLAQAVRKRMLRFEDLVHLPAYRVREAFERADSEDIAVALRTATGDVRDKVLSSLAGPQARDVRRRMARVAPFRLSEVEAAQERLAERLRQVRQGQYQAQSEVANEITA